MRICTERTDMRTPPGHEATGPCRGTTVAVRQAAVPRHRLDWRAARHATVRSGPRGSPPPMKLVFAGTPEVAVPALDALIASGRHEVAAVVTRPDAPAGRGRRLVASP